MFLFLEVALGGATHLKPYLRRCFAVALLLLACAQPIRAQEEWESRLSPFTPGSFPELRPVSVKYNFGWNGITAASGDLRFTKTPEGHLQFDVTGGSTGLARSLWEYDTKHTALSDARTLRPIRVDEVETIRGKQLITALTFTPEGVTSLREERKGTETKSKTRRFEFPDLLSLNSALLYQRTQPLKDGAVQRFVVYPSTSAYLCTITVAGRDRVSVPTGTYDAIKLDLKLDKVSKKRELQPHKKFRSATIWLSDDADRLVLRIETKIFVGTVFAELQSVQFEQAND